MRVAPFRPEHLAGLRLQDAQHYLGADIADPAYARALLQGVAMTGLVGDRVICCAGAVEQWAGRAIVWALVSRDAGPHMKALHRAAVGFVEQLPHRRVESWVDSEFSAGHRWMSMLGFVREGTMQGFAPDGRDFDLYARVRHE